MHYAYSYRIVHAAFLDARGVSLAFRSPAGRLKAQLSQEQQRSAEAAARAALRLGADLAERQGLERELARLSGENGSLTAKVKDLQDQLAQAASTPAPKPKAKAPGCRDQIPWGAQSICTCAAFGNASAVALQTPSRHRTSPQYPAHHL